MTRFLVALSLVALTACVDDSADSGGDPVDTGDSGTSDSGATGGDVALTSGTWVSEGDNVSLLLAYFDIVRVEAAFRTDGTYDVASTDESGAVTTLDGTYAVETSTVPHTITLNQTTPQSATAAGIWQITGTTLTYEVVQTSPAVGCSAPTPDTGFGSTRCSPPLAANANVQTFVRR
jgi:hypothetical protein